MKPGDRFYGEQGVITIANRTIHDWKKYGWLTFQQVLQYSSNVGPSRWASNSGGSATTATSPRSASGISPGWAFQARAGASSGRLIGGPGCPWRPSRSAKRCR